MSFMDGWCCSEEFLASAADWKVEREVCSRGADRWLDMEVAALELCRRGGGVGEVCA